MRGMNTMLAIGQPKLNTRFLCHATFELFQFLIWWACTMKPFWRKFWVAQLWRNGGSNFTLWQRQKRLMSVRVSYLNIFHTQKCAVGISYEVAPPSTLGLPSISSSWIADWGQLHLMIPQLKQWEKCNTQTKIYSWSWFIM